MANKPSNINELYAELSQLRDEWERIQTNPRMRFDAELEWAIQACSKSDKALEYALGNPGSVANALRNIAGVGITLDPARKLAYLLPRDNAIVYDLSYMGMLDIAISSGAIAWGQAHLVHENDVFELMGYDAPPVHKRNPFAKPETRGACIGAYVVVKTAGGDYLTNTMAVDDINAIRQRAPGGGAKGPWKTDWPEMAKKTVVKNAYKYWPRTEALDKAVHYLNTDGGQGVTGTEDAAAAERADLRATWAEKAKAADASTDLRALLAEGRKAFEAAGDVEGYNEFKTALTKRSGELHPKDGGPVPTQPKQQAAANESKVAAKGEPSDAALRKVLAAIAAAKTVKEVEATGTDIDALPPMDQGPANRAYNERLDAIEGKKTGTA